MRNIILCDEKYEVRLSDDCLSFEALRYGQKWRDLNGDNLILGLCERIFVLEDKIKELNRKVEELDDECRDLHTDLWG
jgi:hypothetical protein